MVIPDPLRPGQDWVKLLDFGIAKVGGTSAEGGHVDGPAVAAGANPAETAAGTTMGTPVYMAPEQDSSAATVDGMADVFSFGVMLYEMIAGRRPYKETWLGLRTTPAESLHKLRDATPADLSALVLHMLALSPADRPQMAEVQARLAQVLEQLDSTEQAERIAARALPVSVPPPQPQPIASQRRRSRLWWAVGGFVGIALVVAGLLGYRMVRAPTLAEARERALLLVKRSLQSRESGEEVQAVRALGKSHDNDYRSLLEPLLRDAPSGVIAAAARGLAEISAVESQGALLAVLDKSQDPTVRMEAAAALAQLAHPKGLEVLRAQLQSGDATTKPEAALRLLEFGDRSGAAFLHKLMEGAGSGLGAGDERQLPVLAALARAGDPQALQLLAQRFQAAHAAGKMEPLVAFSMAQLGEPAARSELLQLASQTGPEQLIAARFLSALGHSDGYGVLLAAGADGKIPERQREVAFDGLGDAGQTGAAGMLARALDESAVTARFRLSAAGAILQLAGGAVEAHSGRSLSWARAALASDSSATRELAVLLLGDLDAEEAIPTLRQALKDPDRAVRGGVVRALGRKKVRAALEAVSDALDDADEEVRTAGMRSIGKVATALQAAGERGFATGATARLGQLKERGTDVDRIVAAGVLFLLGDRQQLDALRQGLGAGNALVRRLAVELLDADTALLLAALKDSDGPVRFAAACRLALLGQRDGSAVLRGALTDGGSDGLLAYSLLLKLGESVEPPSDYLGLFAGGGLREKEVILDLLPNLPADIALDLLLRSSTDASNLLRRRSAEMAYSLFLRTLQNAFRQILQGLRNDKDVTVRARATVLVEKLSALTAEGSQAEAERLVPHASLLKRPVVAAAKTATAPAVPAAAKPANTAAPNLTGSKPGKGAAKAAAGGGGAATKTSLVNDPRAKTMGLIQVFVMKKGRCQKIQEYFLPPGDHILNVAGGASQTVSVYAGSVIPVRQCP